MTEFYLYRDSFLLHGGKCLIPVINMRKTGINLRLLMDKKGISVKDVKDYLGLTSIQSVYNWLNGLNMPTIDNLYALSQMLDVSIDEIVRGNKNVKTKQTLATFADYRRFFVYYKRINWEFSA